MNLSFRIYHILAKAISKWPTYPEHEQWFRQRRFYLVFKLANYVEEKLRIKIASESKK